MIGPAHLVEDLADIWDTLGAVTATYTPPAGGGDPVPGVDILLSSRPYEEVLDLVTSDQEERLMYQRSQLPAAKVGGRFTGVDGDGEAFDFLVHALGEPQKQWDSVVVIRA